MIWVICGPSHGLSTLARVFREKEVKTLKRESTKHRTQRRLEEELERLKAKVGLAGHLRVVWDPQSSSGETRGMVEGSTIFVFDVDEEETVFTLRHEYIEYILTHEFLTPRIFEAKAHRRSDALVDIIAGLI